MGALIPDAGRFLPDLIEDIQQITNKPQERSWEDHFSLYNTEISSVACKIFGAVACLVGVSFVVSALAGSVGVLAFLINTLVGTALFIFGHDLLVAGCNLHKSIVQREGDDFGRAITRAATGFWHVFRNEVVNEQSYLFEDMWVFPSIFENCIRPHLVEETERSS